jgi:hypothetical protein
MRREFDLQLQDGHLVSVEMAHGSLRYFGSGYVLYMYLCTRIIDHARYIIA